MHIAITLDDCIKGDMLRLVAFGQTDFVYKHQLCTFGLVLGTEVRVVHIAPFGCPVQIDVRGCALVLRKTEARELQWERV